jgi:hypothetical protein
MTNAVREWVVYHPPKSVSFGHQSTPRNPRLAWPKVDHFLGGLTDVEFGHFSELTLYGPGNRMDDTIARSRLEEARVQLGPEIESPGGPARWRINESQIRSAVDFALADDKFPKQQLGPTGLHFYYRFLWTEFEQLPYWAGDGDAKNRKSHLGVTVGSGRLFLQPTFIFPAPWNSTLLRDFITQVEKIVPVRFRDQYFKRCVPTKKSELGRLLKLPKNWREPMIPVRSQPP